MAVTAADAGRNNRATRWPPPAPGAWRKRLILHSKVTIGYDVPWHQV